MFLMKQEYSVVIDQMTISASVQEGREAMEGFSSIWL
jgi:hypothetical protein